MPELRWTLLIIGIVFLAGLAWWELRRSRRGLAGAGDRPGDALAGRELSRSPAERPAADGIKHEPTITLPEVLVRELPVELPIVEVLDDDSLIGLRVDGAREEFQGEPASAGEASEPIIPAAPEPSGRPEPVPMLGITPVPQPLDPIVEWPDESVRRIVALRLVAPSERFTGRAVRQALSAEGFVLGKLSIFHRAAPDGRAVVSVASLAKPGTFDPDSIDMQRYGGLNLFAVLPGPLSPLRAFEELLAAARNLSERLQGALQDERGEPLTPMRAAMIREALAGEAEASG
ncbi:MAG: cell division protein ZipA C-terminal FtsZ-binding domain-containing protein [Steroidobacteraceae bacterium]